jgi:lipopolysaccharide assembly outer membrane protein LptD (OstA)
LLIAALFLSWWSATALAAAPAIQIHADVVTASSGGQVLEASGHVVITDRGITLRADRVLYTRASGRIQLTGHVSITTPQGELVAGAATAQVARGGQLAAVEAAGAVTVRSADRTVRAERVTYQPKDETLVATGGVVVTYPPDLTITGGRLEARGAEVAAVTGRPRIQHPEGFIEGDRIDVAVQSQIAFVRGTVVSAFGETTITSSLATVLVKERKAIFRDHVTVVRPGRTLISEVVTYYYTERRLVAEGQTTIKIQQTPP